MDSLPYVLVAERSVIPLIGVVCEALQKYGNALSVHIIVPADQVAGFRSAVPAQCQVVVEDEILPDWPLSRVKAMLPKAGGRAGWYLQQFLKLQFGASAGIGQYVIWDADTVLLRSLEFMRNGRILMNRAREHHAPYFHTFQRLFGQPAVLKSSVISQYMLVDSAVITQMTGELEQRHSRPWIEAVLAALPGNSLSEFSEYETYANYLECHRPGSVILQRQKWFRYGAEVVNNKDDRTLAAIERRFRGYAYVAFERHPGSLTKRIACRAAHAIHFSS